MSAPTMVHLSLTSKGGGKWVRLFGELVAADVDTITIERDVYDSWRCTSSTVVNRIERTRIKRSSIDLPATFTRGQATN